MKLFSFAKTLLTWQEPIFFRARMRERRDWILRGILAGVIALVMFGAMQAEAFGPKGKARFGIVGGLALSAFIGVFLTSLLDAPDMNRSATITEKEISSFGNAGHVTSWMSFKLDDIHGVRLVRPETSGRSFGIMEVHSKKGVGLIGVPKKIPIERVADAAHKMGVPVELEGWVPPDPTATTLPYAPPPPPSEMPAASARVEKLPEGEIGKIITPFRFGMGMTLALAPLVVTALPGLGGMGYALYRVFVSGGDSLETAGYGFGGMALVVVGFWFTLRYANLAPSLYLRRAIRNEIEMRPNAVLDAREDDLWYVDVIPRANWGKAMVKEFSDTGFLKIDPLSRCVLFEGDQERWRIPAASLISAAPESYKPGNTPADQEGEVFWVAVMRANVNGEVWEAPLSKCHTEFSPKTNAVRKSNAEALCEAIRGLRHDWPA